MRKLWLNVGLALLSLALQAADLTLRVEGQESVPPKYIFNGITAMGICPDVLRALEKVDPGLRFTGGDKPLSLKLIEQGLAQGQIDVACALLDTEKRRVVATRIETPVYRVQEKLLAKADDDAVVDSLPALVANHAMVVTYKGAGYVKFLQNLGIAVDDSSSDGLTCIRKVMGGRARFFYMNDLTLAQLVRDNHLQKDVRILKAVLHEEPSYFWLSRRQSTEVAERLNRDLARLDSNGELARIYRRYGDLNTDRP